MAVSDKVFSRLVDSNPTMMGKQSDVPQSPSDIEPEPASSDPTKAQAEATVGSGEYLWESLKKGLMSGPEMANMATRLVFNPFIPEGRFKQAIQPGAVSRNIVNEDVLRKDPGALTKAVAPMAEGLGMLPYGFMRGLSPSLLGAAGKSALVTMGASEGSALGREVGGALGEFVGGQTGKQVGEAGGSILGGMGGGYANVVRANAVVQGGKMATKAAGTGVSSVAPAMKAAFAAKRAGDERSLFNIFMDQYGDLRKFGLGFLQDRTNAKIADVIMRDPRSATAIEDFRNAAATTLNTGEEKLFSTSQVSDNPTLYRMELGKRTTTPQEGAEAMAREGARRGALTSAYKRIVDKALPTDQKGLEASINAFGTGEMNKITSLENDAMQIRTGVTNFSSEGMKANGQALREQWDQEIGKSRAINEANYKRAFDLDTQGVDIAPVRQATKGILTQFESKIKDGTAPESIINLDKFIAASQKKDASKLILPESVKGAEKDVRVPLRDLDKVIKDLGADTNRYYRAYETTKNNADLSTARNLEQVRNSLLSSVGTTNPEAAAAYQLAQGRYATEHAPRFNTGISSAMEVERNTAGTRGRPRIVDEQLFNQFLNKGELPTRMEEFDRTFGGVANNRAAYDLLGKAVEDKFSKEVLNSGFSVDKAEKFAKEYESALDRLPNVRDKLARTAERLDQVKAEQEQITANFKELTGSPLTKDIGPMAAQQLFVQALSDPQKMEKLLASTIANTPEKAKSLLKEAMLYANPVTPQGIDYTRLATLMEAGQHRADMPNTLEMLVTKALGKEEGKAHLDRLGMISELMRRDANLDPAHLRIADFKSSDSPVRQATGQTVASWMTGFRSMDAGFGKHYFPMISAGRFVNTQVQQAVDRSIQKALYDPEASQAVLAMVSTPSNQPISTRVLDSIFGNATEIRRIVQKDLLEKGLVRKMTDRGTAIGGVTYLTDQERQKKRDERRKSMSNIDLGEQ